MIATLSSFFAAIALLVAAFGLFGLLTYSVTLRTREIGVRMALGSQRNGILRLILREALVMTLLGIGIRHPLRPSGCPPLPAHALHTLLRRSRRHRNRSDYVTPCFPGGWRPSRPPRHEPRPYLRPPPRVNRYGIGCH